MEISKVIKQVLGKIKVFLIEVLPSKLALSISKNELEFYMIRGAKAERYVKKYDMLMYRPHLRWLRGSEFQEVQDEWGHTGLPLDRRYTLFHLGQHCSEIEGDTVDIGIAYGTSSYFFLTGLGRSRDDRKHFIFDSFEGLSEPDKSRDGTHWGRGDLAVTEDIVRSNLKQFTTCVFLKGWIPKRFSEVSERRFAFVHIDVDLYDPTFDSLTFFYDKVVSGGMILCDDYGFLSCPGAFQAFEDFFKNKPEKIFRLATGQSLIIKK